MVSWSLIQLIVTTLLMYFMFFNYGNLDANQLVLYGMMVFVGVFGYTAIMDQKKYGLIAILVFCGYGTYLILSGGDWFGINTYWMYGSYTLLAYFTLTTAGAIYISMIENKDTLALA